MPSLRWSAFVALASIWTVLFALPIPFLALTPDRRPVRALTRLWARGVLLLLHLCVGLRHTVLGRHHVPRGPCLILCNHQSVWETVAVLTLFPDVAIVAKHELTRIPIIGWYLRRSPMIVIDREAGASAARHMAREGRRSLVDGRPVLVFPEGTRVAATRPIAFRRGAELMRDPRFPLVPMVVDSGAYWPSGGQGSGGTILVSILKPVAATMTSASAFTCAEEMMEYERHRLAGLRMIDDHRIAARPTNTPATPISTEPPT
ncbi:lysophospholipid acyltransferase family protein [Sphingomonas molluscorum]|uniref:lysophospholipid acyltransferase family protein n=1 Tax=Sphingomonas molluscorum TaxID=418184 RepID=UPI0031D8DCDB